MIRNWLNATDAVEFGIALADQYVRSSPESKTAPAGEMAAIQALLGRADREVRPLRLNVFKKAKFANSFKWRLLENGVDKITAGEVTQALVLHLSGKGIEASSVDTPIGKGHGGVAPLGAKQLFAKGNKLSAQGAYEEAAVYYEDLVAMHPQHAAGLNNLGAVLSKLGRLPEAQTRLAQAMQADPNLPDAYSNLATLLRWQGNFLDAERLLRRALKLNPRFVDARVNLGLTLALCDRGREAKPHFEKALKMEPRNSDALFGLALIARSEGRFDDAGKALERTLRIRPDMPSALASQTGIRRMTPADAAWLQQAEKVVASGIAPMDESELRFAMGKYFDDIGDFARAFKSYKRGNELLKPLAQPYTHDAREQAVRELKKCYDTKRGAIERDAASDSMKPVFVVGMPRSGTSLVEQIVASHPSAKGAGEMTFWDDAVREHGIQYHQTALDESAARKLAERYLQSLSLRCGEAIRIVDKAPVNSDYLGIIHAVFPNARIIYVQRDPIDVCLSCYFQKFTLAQNYAMDLTDLAHYYRQHRGLMAHWRSVLPQGTILDVPYAELVVEQEAWTRKILAFLGLDWREECLQFQDTKRSVATASFWQVRQRMFSSSVGRWRNYRPFVQPLLDLRDLSD